jgi:SpoVK/Ycf46/Vps4 family AAA+-type ATPase
MTQQQMEATQKMLPAPDDDAGMAEQKMQALRTTMDPLRKQAPHIQGAEQTPSWLEKRQQKQQKQKAGTIRR